MKKWVGRSWQQQRNLYGVPNALHTSFEIDSELQHIYITLLFFVTAWSDY